MYQYPYGNAQQLNLDWLLSKIQELEAGSGGGADLEEVANALVSASFDSGVSYRRYDYCFYNGKLYRALNDNIGAFNPSDWMEVTLGADIPVLTRLVNADSALITTLQNQLQNLGSDEVANESTVTGTTVSDALGNLNGALTNIGSFTTTSITTQVDALGSGEYVGTVTGSTTGLPVATSGVIQAVIYNTNYKRIFYYPNGVADTVYVLAKSGGTWQSAWTLLPSRSEVDGKVPTSRTVNGKSLSNNVTLASGDIGDDSGAGGATVKASLTALANAWNPATITSVFNEEGTVTLNAYNVYKIGRMVFIYINITLSQQLATNTNILSGLPGAVATWAFLGGSPETDNLAMFFVNSSGYLKNSGTAPAEHFLIIGTYISAN